MSNPVKIESSKFTVTQYIRNTALIYNGEDWSTWCLSDEDCFSLAILLLEYVSARRNDNVM